jgi:hypothetical protein
VTEQKPDYPLTTSPVSGKPIEDGKAVDLVLEGTLVRLCCKQCVDAAKKDATTIVTQVQSAAFTAQKSNYPLATCAISGKPLGDRSASTMVGTSAAPGTRWDENTVMPLILPLRTCGMSALGVSVRICKLPPIKSLNAGAVPL